MILRLSFISLLIWNLIEKQLRDYIAENNCSLPGWNNQTTVKPTTYMLSTKFNGVTIYKKGNNRILSKEMNDVQKAYLKAIKVDETIFTELKN